MSLRNSRKAIAALLVVGLFVAVIGQPLWAQTPAPSPAPNEAQPGDFFWQEVLIGTGGAYLGGLGGAVGGALLGGCLSAGSFEQLAQCVLYVLGGYVVGSTVGATAGVAMTAGFHNVEGNLFLAPLGSLAGTIGGGLVSGQLPDSVPALIRLTVPAFSASLLAAAGFNVGAHIRTPKVSLMSLSPVAVTWELSP